MRDEAKTDFRRPPAEAAGDCAPEHRDDAGLRKVAGLGGVTKGAGSSFASCVRRGNVRAILLCTLLLTCSLGWSPASDTEGAEARAGEWQFTVLGMSCKSCTKSVAKALKKGLPGIRSVSVEFSTKQARFIARQPVTKEQVRASLASLGFELRFPDDPAPLPRLPAELRAELDIKTVSRGEAISIEENLAPGKYTIFDYVADWCGPCHLLTPKLERLVAENDRVALRIVDISDWESPAGKQATREFEIPGLPYVRVYRPDGSALGQVHGNHIEMIRALIDGESSERE